LFGKVEDDPHMLDMTFLTGGAWFHLKDYMNSQDTHRWLMENPKQFMKLPFPCPDWRY
jgi:hypothetical protein